MNILKWFSPIIFILGTLACGNPEPAAVQESAVKALFDGDENGLFRGSNMGAMPDEVLKNEEAALTFASDSLLEYDLSFSYEKESVPTKLYYSFDEYGLFEIQIDLTVAGESRSALQAEISKFLSDQFGEVEKDGSFMLWTTNSASNRLIEITCIADQQADGTPFLSLNYLEQLGGEL